METIQYYKDEVIKELVTKLKAIANEGNVFSFEVADMKPRLGYNRNLIEDLIRKHNETFVKILNSEEIRNQYTDNELNEYYKDFRSNCTKIIDNYNQQLLGTFSNKIFNQNKN